MASVVIIKAHILADLLRSYKKLSRLERGGVDNWEWYGESLGEKDENGDTYADIAEMSDKDLLYVHGYDSVEI